MEQKLTNKETQNWLKCMLATYTTRDVIAQLADVGFKAFYTHVRSGLLAQQGLLETTTCNLCSNPSNMCGLCSEIGNKIWDNHRFKKAKLKGPSWSNTDSTKWCIDSWELAKCYMPPTGYKDKPDADSTDFNGIIGDIYNCTWMQCYFTNDLSKDSNICAKAREEVNKLRHIQDTNINDGDMISFFDCLFNLLNDPGHLNSFKPSVDARTYLTQLQQDTLPLSENAVSSTMKKINEDQKEEFRELLIEHYRQTQSTVSVSPICDGRDKPIHTVFVRPTLIHVAIENDGSRRKTDKEVHHYRELFYKENKLNKRVIIQGEPGMGKTTLLSKFVLDWCEAASSESQKYSANFSDLETLQGFKFLFHLNLRDSPKTFEVVKMIKTQLINKMYADEDERTQVYKILQHIMKSEKCILCMDGLNEWTTNNSDPFPLIATCHKQCVALITTRPWKMADKRIKDSGIDLLIEISGIMDKNQLAIFVLKSLQTNNSKSYAEFMLFVEEKKLHQFLASPWLLTLLVSVWINSHHFSGSLCELNCILIDNLFRKATTVEGIFSHAQFRCLKETNFIYPHVEILNSLAKLAFECTFSSGKSLVFSKEKVFDSLSQELLTFSLQAGILSERYISPIKSQFSFLHETVQEFLAAFHIAKSNDISISSILGSIRHVLEISQVFVYLCGLNTEKANTLLDSDVYDLQCDISHGLSSYVKRLYHKNMISVVHDDNTNYLNIVLAKRNNTETNVYDSNARCVSIAILFQSMLIAGFKEAEASDQNVSYLVCNDFIFHEYLHDSELGDLKSMLMNNTLRVRSLILRSNTLQTKEILTVLQMSKACLTRLMIPAHHDLYRAFSDLNITELVLETYIDAPVLSDAIKSLSMLTYLRLTECNLQYVLCVPVSLKHLELYKITCSAVYLSRLLVLLSSLDHSIQLFLCYCSLAFDNHKTNSAYDRANTDKLVVHSELLSCDMSRIDLLVINGSRDLYELLRGTSIGILALSTTDDVSLAADILPSLSKLKTLHIWGTFKDRGCVQLPPTLKGLELCEVKCSTEWFGSLLIKLASLHHQVKCYLFDAAVNNRYTEDGLVVSMSDEHSELLSCDMSRIDLLVINGSRDLYELLRGTSIGILALKTTDDVSLAADILPTLSKLETLNIWGTFKDRGCVQLPPTLKLLYLREVKCSTEWFGSLLIKLASLHHQVQCSLFDTAVNNRYTEDGLDVIMSDVQSESFTCDMSRIKLFVKNGNRDLYELLHGTSIRILSLGTTNDVSLAADILPTLSKLETLHIRGTFKDRGCVQLPPTLKQLKLCKVKCSTEWFGSLLIKLASLHHQVRCNLFDTAVNNRYTEDGLDVSMSDVQSESFTCDLSRIKLFVKNGNRDLYELLHGTSIRILSLGTTDDVSLAADILPTLSKLETLHIWGTCKDIGCVQLPPTLKRLEISEVKCSTEWFGSLLIKLASLHHQVRCNLFDTAVNNRYTEDGLDVIMSDVQSESFTCDMSRIKLFVKNGNRDLYELLHGTSIRILSLGTTDDVSLAADILPTLSKLETLHIRGTFKDRGCVQLPPTLKRLKLCEVKCSTEWFGSLLIKLASLHHQVRCNLFDTAVNNRYTEDGLDVSMSDLQSELFTCDLSRIKLFVKNGNRDLYELLHGTSIRILSLGTTDDASLAADILPTLSKLETLHIRGTFKDIGCVQLPPTLKRLKLCKVKCSTEWFGSLLIKLSSLHHQVRCNLFDTAVNNRYTEDGLDVSMSDVQSESFTCDLSRIKLFVKNGNRDLYELLHGTSIRILSLGTTDDVSLAADILPTLSKLETLHIRGTFKDRGCVQLPPTLKQLKLCKVKCSTEWFGSLLIKLASLHHQVRCNLFDTAVNNRYAEDGLDVRMSDVQSELFTCDLSRIDLFFENGNRDLYGLLRGTSIGNITINTTDDIALAANVLPNQTKLESKGCCAIV